jgi:hypothetical protein
MVDRTAIKRTQIQCDFHAMFDLPHSPLCASGKTGEYPDLFAPTVCDAIGPYFWQRFPNLFVSVFQVVANHARSAKAPLWEFRPFFRGPFPPLLDGQDGVKANTATSGEQNLTVTRQPSQITTRTTNTTVSSSSTSNRPSTSSVCCPSCGHKFSI